MFARRDPSICSAHTELVAGHWPQTHMSANTWHIRIPHNSAIGLCLDFQYIDMTIIYVLYESGAVQVCCQTCTKHALSLYHVSPYVVFELWVEHICSMYSNVDFLYMSVSVFKSWFLFTQFLLNLKFYSCWNHNLDMILFSWLDHNVM